MADEPDIKAQSAIAYLSHRVRDWPFRVTNADGYEIRLEDMLKKMPPEALTFEVILSGYEYDPETKTSKRVPTQRATVTLSADQPMVFSNVRSDG